MLTAKKNIGLKVLAFIALVGFANSFFAQTNKIDSLNLQLKSSKSLPERMDLKLQILDEIAKDKINDSILKAFADLKMEAQKNDLKKQLSNIYISIGNCYLDMDVYDKALNSFLEAKSISSKSKDEQGNALALGRMAATYIYTGEYNKSVEVNSEAVKYYESVNDAKSLAVCYGNMGIAYKRLGKLLQAIEFQNKSFEQEKKTGNKKGMASCLNAIGNIYFTHGDYPSALKNYFESLKIQQSLNYKTGISNALSNIGMVYKKQGDFDKALDYSFKSLNVEIELGNKQGTAISFGNIGDIYYYLNNTKDAKNYYLQAAKIWNEIGNSEGIADINTSLGLLFERINRLDSAEYYHNEALKIYTSMEVPEMVANSYFNLANCYNNKGDVNKAIDFAERSLKIANELQSLENMELVEGLLSELYEKKGNLNQSLKHYKAFVLYRDSIYSIEKSNELTKNELRFEFDKKSAEDSLRNYLLQEKKDEQIKIRELEISQERSKKYMLIGGVVILLIVSVFIFNRFQVTRKQKNIIELQKNEVQEQKQIVEEKQKEINDSIKYAKRIQSSFMASEKEFQDYLKDYFILFKPKDIVSGDFYWAYNYNDKFYLCVADSTGHGIPGAFMSLLNMSLMNEALFSKGLEATNEILDFVRRILIIGLKQDVTGQGGNDGMDCAFVCIDKKLKKIQFTGANNPLWILRKGELMELRPDKMPVGRSPKQEIPFSFSEFQLEPDDSLFLFTDGYADQFGGPLGKKFKYKQLENVLKSMENLTSIEKMKLLDTTIENWKKGQEQVDDILIIGIKI